MKKKALDKSLDFMKDWLRFLHERSTLPGFVVAVSHKGKVLFNEAYGCADLEKKEKLTPEHIFRIASHSKTFTATAIMQLQEQGKLKIDDPIVDYIPWLKQHKDKRFLKVTIRQVLSHGAGIIRDGTAADYWQLHYSFPDAERLEKEILASDLVIDNNTKLKYTNYGYSLLGLVVENASGQSYNDYVAEHIVKPLSLKNTGPEYTTAIDDRIVTGYTRPDYKDEKRLPIASNINTHAMSPATGFYSTTEDICKYFTAHIVGSGKLLNDESKKEMQRTHWQSEYAGEKDEYGFGLRIGHIKNRTLIGHSGGFPGHITKTWCDPEDELVVTVLTNAADSWAGYMNKSIIKLIDFFQHTWKEPENGIEKFEGRFMSLWSVAEVIASGNKLILADAGWEMFEYPEEAEHIGGNMFKVTKTSSFGSEGEKITFELGSHGQVNKMNHTGITCLPEKDYLAKTSKVKKIGETLKP